MTRALVVAIVLGSSLAAWAAPIELEPAGSRVTVTAGGVRSGGAIVAHGDAIEVPLAAAPKVESHLDSDDATIKRIELIGGERPRLILKLRHSKHTTEKLAAGTVAEDADGTLRLLVPRQPGVPVTATGPATAAPATSEAKPAAAEAKPAPAAEAKPAHVAEAKPAPVEAKPAPAAEAKPAPVEEAKPAPAAAKSAAAPAAKSATAPKPAPISIVPAEQLGMPSAPPQQTTDSLLDDHKSGPRTAYWVLMALIVGVPGLWWLQRRRAGLLPTQQPLLRVLASQSLGGRSKLVVVDVDGKRILLAVNDRTTRVVANLEAAVAAVAAEGKDDDDEDEDDDETEVLPLDSRDDLLARVEAARSDVAAARNELAATRELAAREAAAAPLPSAPPAKAPSSAVSGLLKLRADADADAIAGAGAAPGSGPSEWGDALRRAVLRVKS